MAGRYGIGARVRDKDGDLGTVVDKRKGERLLAYDDSRLNPNDWWQPKAELTVVAEVLTTASCCVEKGEVAFAIGDRVVATESKPNGHVGTIAAIFSGHVCVAFDAWNDGHSGESDAGGSQNHWYLDNNQIAPFTLEAGKFYRTRDGRKVGPMEDGGDTAHDDKCPLLRAFADGSTRLFRMNGIHLFNLADLDIVAEWVEPAAQPAAADEWTDFDHWDAPPVAAAPATAKSQPKFKVGDRVGIGADDDNPGTVVSFDGNNDRPYKVRWDNHLPSHRHWFNDVELAHANPPPAMPVGTRVSLTGIVSGTYTGGVNILVDGLPSGLNSRAFPAIALKKAA